jgi:hypothetical protein
MLQMSNAKLCFLWRYIHFPEFPVGKVVAKLLFRIIIKLLVVAKILGSEKLVGKFLFTENLFDVPSTALRIKKLVGTDGLLHVPLLPRLTRFQASEIPNHVSKKHTPLIASTIQLKQI